MIDSYSKLPLGKHLEIMEVCEDATRDDLQKQIAIIAILLDTTEDAVLDLPIAEYSAAAKALAFLESAPTNSGRKIGAAYKVGDTTYKPCVSIGEMTAAQYIDFQSYATNANKHYAEICSVFLVPKGMTYNRGYDIAEVQQEFRERLTVQDATDLCAFFLTRYTHSMRAIPIYLKWEAIWTWDKTKKAELLRQKAEAEALLRLVGDGLQMLMPSAKRADASGTRYGI